MEEEKEEERDELDMNCGGITPTSLGSVTNWCQFFGDRFFYLSVFSCTANQC